jgi:hypothetical protein
VYEEFEDTKGVIRIRISKKNRQHNGQKKNYKRTNNDLQSITHKTKDRVTRASLKTGVISGAPEGSTILAPLYGMFQQKNNLLNRFNC